VRAVNPDEIVSNASQSGVNKVFRPREQCVIYIAVGLGNFDSRCFVLWVQVAAAVSSARLTSTSA